MLKSKADGPSLDAQCTVVSLSLHFSSGDSSSCSAEALLLMVDGSKQGWVQLQGLSLPRQCSLRGTRVGKDKTGAMPSAWFSVGAIPSKTAPEPASSPTLLLVRQNVARQPLGLVISAGRRKRGVKNLPLQL